MKRRAIRLANEFGTGLQFIYEAELCGYAPLRRLRDGGWPCELVAPTAIPKKPSDRAKADRRDARALARLSAAGYLSGTALGSGPGTGSVT